jgi:hypothetical protein
MTERALRERLRADDHFCANSDGSFFIVLANCSGDNARVVAHRIGVEVTLRANSVRSRNWTAAVAGYPREQPVREEAGPFTAPPAWFSFAT